MDSEPQNHQAAQILEEIAQLIERAGDNPPREVMDSKEAAEFLRLSRGSFAHIAPSLPRYKPPRMGYRYLRSELLEWLVSSIRPPVGAGRSAARLPQDGQRGVI
jgi:hypothetical protein